MPSFYTQSFDLIFNVKSLHPTYLPSPDIRQDTRSYSGPTDKGRRALWEPNQPFILISQRHCKVSTGLVWYPGRLPIHSSGRKEYPLNLSFLVSFRSRQEWDIHPPYRAISINTNFTVHRHNIIFNPHEPYCQNIVQELQLLIILSSSFIQ